MSQKMEELRAWGCDVDAAMVRMLDDEDFYIECLETIPTDSCFDGLKAALEAGDTEAAFDCAHKLKGILANLGLTPIYNKTVELVEPLRAGKSEGLEGKLSELMEMKDVLTRILE